METEIRQGEIAAVLWLAKELRVHPTVLARVVEQCWDAKPYRTRTILKANGSARTIHVPIPELRKIQRQINRHILRFLAPSPCAFGFSGGSIFDALAPHAKARRRFTVDCEDAFWTITDQDIHKYLCTGRKSSWWSGKPHEYGWFSWYAARILADLMTVKVGDNLVAIRSDGQEVYVPERRMPQGAPTSPRMFDLVCKSMDDTLQEFAESEGCRYTRYADNLIFSTTAQEFPHGFIGVACGIVRWKKGEKPAFTLHKEKLWRVMEGGSFHLLGLHLQDGRIENRRARKQRLRLSIHHVSWLLEHDMPRWEESWARLRGQMEFARHANLSPATRENYQALLERVTALREGGHRLWSVTFLYPYPYMFALYSSYWRW